MEIIKDNFNMVGDSKCIDLVYSLIKLNEAKGFSLIELLVVHIIGIQLQ